MASLFPPAVEAGRDARRRPPPASRPAAARGPSAEATAHAAAYWALDVSAARSLIARAAGGTPPPDWVEALLAATLVADVNQRTAHLVGPIAGRDAMIGQPIASYWPPESRSVLAELIVSVASGAAEDTPRTRRITSLAFSEPLLTAWAGDGPDIVILTLEGAAIDDRSYWLLSASEERYRNLIHHLPCALLQVDSTSMNPIFAALRAEGVTDMAAYLERHPDMALHSRDIVMVTDANRLAAELFAARDPRQLIGAVDYVFAASPATAHRVITSYYNGQRSYSELMKLRRFDGEVRDVQLSLTYPTPPERLDVTLLSFEDVTDRLATEAQLRQIQADYTRAARISILGELATSIAHEVNQPLAAIVTNAETSLRWLARPDPNLPKVVQLTGRIADSARLASDIVQRIRGMVAQGPSERVLLDLNEVVDEALLFLGHEIEIRSIEVSVARGRGLPPVRADRVQLQQVVVNLLLNAVQAIGLGRTGAKIDIVTVARPTGMAFAIHDDGPGVAAGNLERVFDSFFTTKAEGMGIGLAICQSIITAHGGTIAASNHPDGGALFEFTLPAGEA